MSFSKSPASVLSMFDTLAMMQRMLAAEPEFTRDWWTQQKRRLVNQSDQLIHVVFTSTC